MTTPLTVTIIGGPTARLEWGGLRVLTDPTFDGPTVYGPEPDDLTKTKSPAVDAADLGRIDLALVSHHHHEDNLDHAGRAFALTLPLVVTTPEAAEELAARGGSARIIGLTDGETIALDDAAVVGDPVASRAPHGARLHVVPALHGPDGIAQKLGPVCGFVLVAPEHPTVYVSGDNAQLGVVEAVAARFGPVDAALLFAGAATVPSIPAALTLTAADARAAAVALGARRVVGLHVDQWTHFAESRADLEREFAGLESPAGGPLLAHTPLGVRVELELQSEERNLH